MSRHFLSLLFLTLLVPAFAQQTVTVQPGYTHETFYSLSAGTVASQPQAQWDIAFQIGGFAASIRANHATGVEVYAVPGLGISGWSQVDTANFASWSPAYDSDQSWDLGSFNRGLDPGDPFDLGWGVYNPITHVVTGDSLYVIVLADKSVKKLRIDQLAGGTYSFTFANLDGSDERSRTLAKSAFAGKNFGYYSLAADSAVDVEPLSSEWDLVFHKYFAELAPGLYYSVTGIQANAGIETAELRGVDLAAVSVADTAQASFSGNISEIGYDWKSFNMNTFSWELTDSLTYLVKARDGEVYQLTFTGFGGSSSGNFLFSQNNLTTSLFPAFSALQSLSTYPNPTEGQISISMDLAEVAGVSLSLLDLRGREVKRADLGLQSGFVAWNWTLDGLPAGVYLLQVQAGRERGTAKIVLR